MFRRATSKIVHNPTVTTLRGTNQDLRVLQNLILAEKTLLSTLQKLSADLAKASEALKAWGLIEGDDIGGILTASTLLLNHFSSALLQYATHGHSMRTQLKAIRTKVENLDDLKRQKRALHQKTEETKRHLEGMDPQHRNFSARTEELNSLRVSVREMNFSIKLEEAILADFKRTSTKIWMGLKFGGLVECCEKGAIAGRFGKLVIAELSEDISRPGLPRSHNYRRNEVESLLANAHRGVNGVTLSTVPFVGFRDRDQYAQMSQQPSNMPPTEAPSIISDGHHFPPSFPQPQRSYEPLSSGEHPPEPIPYVQETAESSLPQTMPQPEVIDRTVDNNALNVPSTVSNPVTRSNTPVTRSNTPVTRSNTPVLSNTASSNAARDLNADTVSINVTVPAAVIGAVASLDTAASRSNTAGGQIAAAPPKVRKPRLPGTFGGTTPDPYSMRALSRTVEEEKPVVVEAPPPPKAGKWSRFLKMKKRR